MSKILCNPIDEFGIPLFKEPQWIDPADFPQYANQFPKVKVVERKSTRKERSDKGKKRPHYNKVLRSARKEANDLQRIVEDVNRFERKEAAADHSGESKSRAERRRVAREALLPNPRICSHCGKVKLLSKQWVIMQLNGKSFIGCKGCHWKINILPTQKHSKETPHGITPKNCVESLG